MVLAVLLLLIAFYSIITYRKARLWSSGIAIWTAATVQGRGEKSRAWQELGAHYKVQGNLERAAECFARALTLNPRLAPALRNLAWVRAEQGRLEEAVHLLRVCTERNPTHWAGWEDFAVLLEATGQESTRAYEQAVRLNPRAHGSWNRLGLKMFHEEHYTEAQDRFAAAHRWAPQSAAYRWNLACTLRALGKAEAGAKLLQGFPPNIQLTPNMVVPKQIASEPVAAV